MAILVRGWSFSALPDQAMQPDPKAQPLNANSPTDDGPPNLPTSQPPGIGAPPSGLAGSPPPRPAKPDRNSARPLVAILLSLCLGLFLIDGVVSLVDDSLILFFDIHVVAEIRGLVFLFATLVALAVYGLMGLTPMIPKRFFLPLTLFNPVLGLAVVPLAIYFYGRLQQIFWILSICEVIFGLSMLYWVLGGSKFRWPLVAESQLESRRFSWRNVSLFLLMNVFVLLPALIAYLVLCADLAVEHFSEGFVALRPNGLTVQTRKYSRNDGKTIQLVPMSHIGEPDFYRRLSQTFPTNATILIEGVTDKRNLLTNSISYKRLATSLGLAEQKTEFEPRHNVLVPADVDVERFAKSTIDFLNLVMLLHAKGVNVENAMKLVQCSPPPHFQEQLMEDLLRMRNRHLLEEIRDQLSRSDSIIVPWGAAHMPEIANEIQKSGFRLDETQDYVAIRFRAAGKPTRR